MEEWVVHERFAGKHAELTQVIIRVFFEVYNEVGVGFVESVYKECMRQALLQAGLKVQTEMPIPVTFRGNLVGIFKADIVVQGTVIVELKVCDSLTREHEVQTLNYLRATPMEVALLMNFGPVPKFKRLLLDNDKKKSVPSVTIRVKSSAAEGGKL